MPCVLPGLRRPLRGEDEDHEADATHDAQPGDTGGGGTQGPRTQVSVEWDSSGCTLSISRSDVTRWDVGMAETGNGERGWYGEDCVDGDCHHGDRTGGYWQTVTTVEDYMDCGQGSCTLLSQSTASGITYLLVADDDSECYVWGDDASCYSDAGYDCPEP